MKHDPAGVVAAPGPGHLGRDSLAPFSDDAVPTEKLHMANLPAAAGGAQAVRIAAVQ